MILGMENLLLLIVQKIVAIKVWTMVHQQILQQQLYICTQVLKLVGIYSKLIVLCNTYKYNFMKFLSEAQHLSTYFCIGSCEKGYNNINMQNCLYMQILFPEYIALLILYNLYISIGHTCLLVSEIFAYRNNTSLNSHSLSINNQTIIIKKKLYTR